MRLTLTIPLLAMLAACASVPKRVVRDSSTYTAEVLASLARETEAAEALKNAAALVPEEACAETVAPAMLIDAHAQRQAYTALWLAGLPYPMADGSAPDPKVEQADPGAGPAPVVTDAVDWCDEVISGGQ
jgi:hypothetical protein